MRRVQRGLAVEIGNPLPRLQSAFVRDLRTEALLAEWSAKVINPQIRPVMTTENVLDYECRPVMDPLVDALRAQCGEGEFVIQRKPFRWHTDQGVISNGYEMFRLEQIAAENGWEIVYDFRQAAIVRKAA